MTLVKIAVKITDFKIYFGFCPVTYEKFYHLPNLKSNNSSNFRFARYVVMNEWMHYPTLRSKTPPTKMETDVGRNRGAALLVCQPGVGFLTAEVARSSMKCRPNFY